MPETDEVYDKAIPYFGSEEELNRQIDGWLLADGVKVCDLNLNGLCWRIYEPGER